MKNSPISHKIATIISILSVAVWVIHMVYPQMFPIDPSYLAVALFTICEAVICWRNGRVWSCLLIASAVISIACFFLDMML